MGQKTSQPDGSPQSLYSTAPLNYENRDIRIVKLERNTTSAKIKCVLRSYPIQGPHPGYIALSYAWGHNVRYEDIELNGHSFPVGRSLWHFLNQMRLSEKFDTYWIDAICIDQTSVLESNRQVQMMREIYSNAESVYVWLGEEDKAAHSDAAMIYLEKRDEFEAATIRTKTFWTPQQAKAVLSLCKKPYWTRIWIVQELLLSKRVILLCGSRTLPWYHFQRIFDAMTTIVQLGWGEQIGVSSVLASAASNSVRAKTEWKIQSLSLISLLTLCRNQQSTDIRDKIYALHGLANDSNGMEINYGVSAKRLLVVVLENLCTTLQTSMDLRETNKRLLQAGQLLRDILRVRYSDRNLEAIIVFGRESLEDSEDPEDFVYSWLKENLPFSERM